MRRHGGNIGLRACRVEHEILFKFSQGQNGLRLDQEIIQGRYPGDVLADGFVKGGIDRMLLRRVSNGCKHSAIRDALVHSGS